MNRMEAIKKVINGHVEDMSMEEQIDVLVTLNKMKLDNKSYIKKYYRIRNELSDMISQMMNYVADSGYSHNEYMDMLMKEVCQDGRKFNLEFNFNNSDDLSILGELYIYKNHKKIPSLAELYLSNSKYLSNKEKKLLECMNNSFVSCLK